jgi:hypothetical protein
VLKIGEELSLVRFCCGNYFAVLLNTRPFYPVTTLLIKLVRALIQSEPEPDDEIVKRLNWITEHTHEDVDTHISVVELAVFRNLNRSLNKEIELGHKEYDMVQLYKYLDEITAELTIMVIKIGKKYSIDMPMQQFNASNSQQEIKF